MLSPVELMERQALTLFRHDEAGRLRAVNESGDPPAPRLFVGRTPRGNLWRFRHDLPATLVHELEHILATEPVVADLSQPPVTLPRLREVLAAQGPIEQIWQGPAWRFPEDIAPPNEIPTIAVSDDAPLRANFPWTGATLADTQPCLAVVQGNDAVAICCSARTSPEAAEAGVNTVARFRGRGYASAVAAAWACAVREMGRVPLYSTSWDNLASQGVARRLGLVLYGADLHIT